MLLPTTSCPRSLRVGLVMTAALCLLTIIVAGCSSSAAMETAEATVSESLASPTSVDAASAGTSFATTGTELFDNSGVHQVAVTFAQEDYDAMIQTYQERGEKDWILGTVTIDGETYRNVGVRLKGNSSIMELRGGGMDPMRGPGGFPRPTGGLGGNASADAPETLPWLIDLDRSVDNQNHGGTSELVVRSNTTESALNEAVSLGLLEQAGLASQDAVYVRFSVNGSENVLRLLIENPDDRWMAKNFDISGVLYKAESSGDYSYRGDDPDSYGEVFDQEAGKKNADLTPLVEFLYFINNSDDATFADELPDRLDIDAFATYLAVQELIANSDDIDGMGNNSYLYYDTKTHRFTVVAWDHNLAFGMMGGGPGVGGGAVLPGMRTDGFGGQVPEEMQPPEGGQPPRGAQPPQGQDNIQPPEDMGGLLGPGRGFGGKSNILVERFMANPEWKQRYEERLAELRTELYKSGKAADLLDEWVTLLKTQAADLIDPSTVDREAAVISKYFTAE